MRIRDVKENKKRFLPLLLLEGGVKLVGMVYLQRPLSMDSHESWAAEIRGKRILNFQTPKRPSKPQRFQMAEGELQ